MSLRRAGAGFGLLLAGLLVGAYLLAGPMPQAGTPPDRLVAFLSDHSQTQEWSWFLVSGPALLVGPWFLGALAAALGGNDAVTRYLTAAAFASALLAGAILAAAGITWGLLVYLGTQITSPSLVLVLAETRHFAEGAICFPVAGAVLGFSMAAWSSQGGWRVIALLGLFAAGLQLVNGVDDFVTDGVTGLLGPLAFGSVLAWIAAASLALAFEAPVLLDRQPQTAEPFVRREPRTVGTGSLETRR